MSSDATFPATSWTVIRQAQDPSSPEHGAHVQRLVEMYWWPIYFVIRRSWRRSDDEARELTQEFFATEVFGRRLVDAVSPDRGSFRAFLRVCVGHFAIKASRHERRLKRGGAATFLSIDAGEVDPARLAEGPAATASPEELFDHAWTETLVSRALEAARRQLVADGKSQAWEIFQRYEIAGEREQLSYDALGAELGLTGQQVKYALLLARGVFKTALTNTVREYVDGPEELAAELRRLTS